MSIIITVVALLVVGFLGTVIWRHICKFFAGSVGAAIVAFVGVFAASCVSLYSQQLVTQGSPFVRGVMSDVTPPENWEIKLTLSLIGLAVLLIGLREIGLGTVLKVRAKELDERISSLPPQDFLNFYGQGLREIGEIRRETKIKDAANSLNSAELEKSIRVVMKHILGMAKLWDGISTSSDDNIIYRSNIMMVVPPELMEDIKKDAASYEKLVVNSPFFLYGDNFSSRLDNSSGLLMIENNSYTVTSASEGGEPDPKVKPLCLPYATHPHRQPNLPGAPEACVSQSAKYVLNTMVEMDCWLNVLSHREQRFDRRFDTGVRSYYCEARHAQSILSIPIIVQGKTMAVLNIYRNKENIFKGDDRAQQFVALMNPVCYHIGKMLSLASKIA
ncbi:GAF domain-containing protein [Pseudomonas orientalis]|uniref:GAF domain-containing protein n=1 Tax=Pseudomonas orientalis TaxID=76758 RepID=UPI0039875FDD